MPSGDRYRFCHRSQSVTHTCTHAIPYFIESNPDGLVAGGACVDLCGGGGGTDVDDDVGVTSLVDFWISGKKSSLEMVVAWFSGFLWGRIWMLSNFTHCFPLSFDALSA